MAEVGSRKVSFERGRGVYALQALGEVAHAVIGFSDEAQRTSRIQQILRVLADAEVPVFLVKLHRTAVTLAFAGADQTRVESTLASAEYAPTIRRDLALLTVRAATMRELHGVMFDIADALYQSGTRLYETGDSHNSVQCLVDGSHVDAAIDALRRTFQLDSSAIAYHHMDTGDAA